ncbi:MAG: hypothetical protein IJV46_02120, partial [Acidaminococcaceae bacterium]|nr:hypothetical protein [Acidaminococcaceae bacterium]
MNKIYKVIWSKVKNCYIVVSEIAKRNSKSAVNSGFSVTRNILAGAVLLGLTAGVCAPVWATDINWNDNNIWSSNIITVKDSTFNNSNGKQLIAFGYNITNSGKNSILIGNNVWNNGGGRQILIGYSSTGNNCNDVVVIGHDIKANAAQTVTIGGDDTQTNAERAIAIGFKSKANDSAIAIGDTAIADKENSIAMGYKSTSNQNEGVAIGSNSMTDSVGGIALGQYSHESRQAGSAGYDPTGNTHPNTDRVWTSSLAALSVGDYANGYTRQITNVAAGTDPTDAVNVAQLQALETRISESGSDWQLADANGAVGGNAEYKVDNNKKVTLKVKNEKGTTTDIRSYVIDLSGLPDSDTQYTAGKTVTEASSVTDVKHGSANFVVSEKDAEGNETELASLTFQAGENVAITKNANGDAVINAVDSDTQYTAGKTVTEASSVTDVKHGSANFVVSEKDAEGNETELAS